MNKEEYVKSKGWVNCHGYKIDHSMLCLEYEMTFIEELDLYMTVIKTDYWMHTEKGCCYEDIEDVIDILEDELDFPKEFYLSSEKENQED